MEKNECVFSRNEQQKVYYSVSNKLLHLSLQDILIGIILNNAFTKLYSVNSQTTFVGLQKITNVQLLLVLRWKSISVLKMKL